MRLERAEPARDGQGSVHPGCHLPPAGTRGPTARAPPSPVGGEAGARLVAPLVVTQGPAARLPVAGETAPRVTGQQAMEQAEPLAPRSNSLPLARSMPPRVSVQPVMEQQATVAEPTAPRAPMAVR